MLYSRYQRSIAPRQTELPGFVCQLSSAQTAVQPNLPVKTDPSRVSAAFLPLRAEEEEVRYRQSVSQSLMWQKKQVEISFV